MHKELRPEQVDILVGSPAVNDEFSKKVGELDRRLQMNGMEYRNWDTLNDRQHEIFTDNLFLDGQCASSPEHYVKGAVESCGCPDTEEELHHHSPVLMGEIEKQEDMLPDIKVKIGESLNNLNDMIDLMVEGLLTEAEYVPEDWESKAEYDDLFAGKSPMDPDVCKSVGPSGASMKLEYVVIEAARMRANPESVPRIVAPPTADASEGPATTGKARKKKREEMASKAQAMTKAYACARGAWRDFPVPGSKLTLGEEGDNCVTQALESGYFTNSDLAAATMGGVGKTVPAYGGGSIEPKTDLMFGDKRISLKMRGTVQAASAEGPGTAEILGFVLNEWLTENAANSIVFANAAASEKIVREFFADQKKIMIDSHKVMLSSTRYPRMVKKLEDLKNKANEAGGVENLSPGDQKQYAKYSQAIPALEADIMDMSGPVATIKQEWDYDNWTANAGAALAQNLDKLFQQTATQTTAAEQPLSLQATLVDELLSGRRTFKDNPAASAEYLLSPDHCFTLVPGESGYDRTLDYYSRILSVRTDPKGGRTLVTPTKGISLSVGSKPSYRYDIKPAALEAAIKTVTDEQKQNYLKKISTQLFKPESGLANRQDESITEQDENNNQLDSESFIEDTISAMEQAVLKLVAGALDVEQTTEDMIKSGQESEDS